MWGHSGAVTAASQATVCISSRSPLWMEINLTRSYNHSLFLSEQVHLNVHQKKKRTLNVTKLDSSFNSWLREFPDFLRIQHIGL